MKTPRVDLVSEPRWQGVALLRAGVLAFAGSIGSTDRHAHHAVQIMAATTPLTVVDDTGGLHCGTTVIIPADAAHHIYTGAARGSVVFLEPESAPGRAAQLQSVRAGWVADPILDHPPHRPLAAVVTELLERLTPPAAVAPLERHPAVMAALTVLPELVGAGVVRGTDVAARVGVSASRLTHLFTEQVGIPLRRYVLWLRLRIAITRMQAGDDLTDAAHAAGFADSAHLTRTCRDMFGLPPSVLNRHVSWDIDDRS